MKVSIGVPIVVTTVLAIACQAQFRDVTVHNTPANPVPVQQQGGVNVTGSVSISGTPAVSVTNTPNVNVTNSPAVTVTNTPNVNVTNSTTAPLPTRNNDNPARNLVQPNVGCVALVGSLSCSATYSVPIGQTLVIDYIDFMSQVVTATANYSRISVVAGGTSRQFFFEPGSLSGDSSLLMKSGPVQIFADGGSTVTFDAYKTATTGILGINFTFSGHLVSP